MKKGMKRRFCILLAFTLAVTLCFGAVGNASAASYLSLIHIYCKNLIRSLMGIEEISLFPVSAKKETGLEPLKENIVKDCEEKGTEIMEEAALLKLRDIVESALRQISLYRAAMNLSAEDFKEKLDALETYCQGIKAEARQNCDRIITSPAYMEGQLNRIKNHLSHKVSELFGMDYYYDIEEIEMKTENQEEKAAEDFIAQADEICDTLQETLHTIFLYREENAYKVVRRTNDLNKLVRSLVKMRGDLEKL